jgi:hypothetical protein
MPLEIRPKSGLPNISHIPRESPFAENNKVYLRKNTEISVCNIRTHPKQGIPNSSGYYTIVGVSDMRAGSMVRIIS